MRWSVALAVLLGCTSGKEVPEYGFTPDTDTDTDTGPDADPPDTDMIPDTSG